MAAFLKNVRIFGSDDGTGSLCENPRIDLSKRPSDLQQKRCPTVPKCREKETTKGTPPKKRTQSSKKKKYQKKTNKIIIIIIIINNNNNKTKVPPKKNPKRPLQERRPPLALPHRLPAPVGPTHPSFGLKRWASCGCKVLKAPAESSRNQQKTTKKQQKTSKKTAKNQQKPSNTWFLDT